MRKSSSWALGTALLIVSAGACRTLGPEVSAARQSSAAATIATWSEPSRLLAGQLIEEYGLPDRVEPTRLVWQDKHLWKQLAVRDAVPDSGAGPGAFILEQTVSYPVPPEALPALAAFSGDIHVSPDGAKLTARADSEGSGFLALNLAYEIIRGIKTPEEAREFYDLTMNLSVAGKTSSFMQGLLFLPRPLP